MDEVESKEGPSLPPDYVSLAQLQERWMKKQQEKKLKENQEAERKEIKSRSQNDKNNQRGLKSDAQQKKAGLSLNGVPRRRGEKYDGGKGKEIGNVGSENAEKKKTKKKKKKMMMNNRENEKKKSTVDGREGAEIVEEIEVKVGNKGLLFGEISGNNDGLKGIEQIVNVNMVEVLPAVKAVGLRGGFTRNRGNRCSQLNNSRKEYRVRVHDLENQIENEKGYGKKWIEGRGNDDSCYRLKENDRDDVFKSSEFEPEAERKAEDGNSEGCSEMNINKTEEEYLNDNSVELEKKVDNGVLAIESVRNTGNVYQRHGNERGRKGSKFSRMESNGYKSGKLRSNGISEGCSEMNRNKTEEEYLNDNSVELEKKIDNGVLAIESVRNTGNVYRRHGNERGRKGSKFSHMASNSYKSGKVRSNVGDYGRFAWTDRLEGGWDIKRRESDMMWVKKEKKSGGDAAEVSSYGVSEDQA